MGSRIACVILLANLASRTGIACVILLAKVASRIACVVLFAVLASRTDPNRHFGELN